MNEDGDDDFEHLLLHSTIESQDCETNRPFTLFAKKPTQIATLDDQHIPLHIQFPPVPFLSWEKSDELVNLGALESDTWFRLTAAYRDERAAMELHLRRSPKLDVKSDALISEADLKCMVERRFAIDTGLSVKVFKATFPHHAFVKLFATIENRNNKDRRRLIAWPRSMNEAERMLAKELESSKGQVEFDKAQKIRDNGVSFDYSCSLDLKKYYQQFELRVKHFFAFKFKDRVYLLDSIPTGAVGPPLFSQILSKTLLRIAVRSTSTTHLIKYDLCIDNLRLMSNNIHALSAAWFELIHLCDHIGITIGESIAPALQPVPYTYLGMKFDSSEVRLSDKSKTKVATTITTLKALKPTSVIDVMAMFGHTVWSCIVVDFPLGKLYHVIKFMRRLSKKNINDILSIWPSIIGVDFSSDNRFDICI